MIGPVIGVLFDGFAYGMLLFLLSVGLSVTLGMMNFVNLAHCAFAMLGAYVTVFLMNTMKWPFLATLPFAFLAAAFVSVLLERTLYRPLYRASDLDQVLLTIGLDIEHQIWVSLNNIDKIHNKISIGYIIQVYSCVEAFFYDFQREYNVISVDQWHFESGNKFEQIKDKFVNRTNIYDYFDEYLIDIFTYYHRVRIKGSHPRTVSDEELSEKHEKAVKHTDLIHEKYKIINSPKQFDKLDFEDYFLFTMVSKDLCLKISSICKPAIEGLIDHLKLNRFMGLENDKRKLNAIALELHQHYGVEVNESNQFVKEILEKMK